MSAGDDADELAAAERRATEIRAKALLDGEEGGGKPAFDPTAREEEVDTGHEQGLKPMFATILLAGATAGTTEFRNEMNKVIDFAEQLGFHFITGSVADMELNYVESTILDVKRESL